MCACVSCKHHVDVILLRFLDSIRITGTLGCFPSPSVSILRTAVMRNNMAFNLHLYTRRLQCCSVVFIQVSTRVYLFFLFPHYRRDCLPSSLSSSVSEKSIWLHTLNSYTNIWFGFGY